MEVITLSMRSMAKKAPRILFFQEFRIDQYNRPDRRRAPVEVITTILRLLTKKQAPLRIWEKRLANYLCFLNDMPSGSSPSRVKPKMSSPPMPCMSVSPSRSTVTDRITATSGSM